MEYGRLVEEEKIELLSDRREAAALEFAKKNAATSRFGDKWFKRAMVAEREVRTTTHRKYEEMRCKTERARNNPVQYMVRLLNKLD